MSKLKKIVILDASTLGEVNLQESFSDFGEVEVYSFSTPEEVTERIKTSDIIITNKALVTREAIEGSPHLELICVAATGMNNIDLSFAAEKGIPVKNVSGYSTMSVVQHTFALIFGLLNKVCYFDNYCKTREGYSSSKIFTSFDHEFWEISGKTIGIIGLGTIGKRVADVASAFGAEVIYYSTSGKNNDHNYRRVSLEQLLAQSDIISIHAPLNDNTRNLIAFKEMQQMKKGGLIINTGRGGIINETDLAEALNQDIIGGAALDVFEAEPLKSENPLLSIRDKSKILLSPHIAWASKEARQRLIKGIQKNIRHHLENV
jgi:lactate dehydrogenase-like 2-hydroxyacid dehydrogenase